MSKKSIFNWALLACVLGMAVVCFLSIYNDISFEENKNERQAQVIQRLMQLRDAEESFKTVHNGEYCGDIDSLVEWVKEGKAYTNIIKEGELTDDQLEAGLTEAEAVAQGIIKRDTVWVDAAELLNISNPDSLKLIPVGRAGATFQIAKDVKENTRSNQIDKVCEIRARLEDYLYGLDEHAIKNFKTELRGLKKNKPEFGEDPEGTNGKWYGLRMGDLADPANKFAGNWD